ncbi:rna-directed dna polymerase from mobile element jockey-like [Pitangus sulphuratus]|nr:rna-directed dna polymerase from mobile element jockey-like [Pitangus sulphuratus]
MVQAMSSQFLQENAVGDSVKGFTEVQVRIRGKTNRADILVGVCYRPPNQDEEEDELFYKQLVIVSQSLALVLMGGFNWKYNTAEKKQSRRFLECVQDNFLTQLVRKPTREGALLGLLFVNREGLPAELEDRDREENKALIIQGEMVSDLLRHLDSHKSMGLDGIHPRVLREMVKVLTKPLCLTGKVTGDWKLSAVMPIYKKGWKADPRNYKPIRLTLVTGKIME